MLCSDDCRPEQKDRPEEASEANSDSAPDQIKSRGRQERDAAQELPGDASLPPLSVSITILQPEEVPKPIVSTSKCVASQGGDKVPGAAVTKKGFLSRSASYQEQCRICQQETEETLIDLGCRCRGELAKAHRSCIVIWFHTRGSNKCEICQQITANVPPPESQPTSDNFIWRMHSEAQARQERERRCLSPLWVAFAILVGGLLLDVLVSVSLGVSALPVNIIIGVLIVLGLGTSFRLALECCQEWGSTSRRNLQTSSDLTLNPGYHPTV